MTAQNIRQAPKSDYQSVTKLMKAMGSKTGFDPLPPDQHAWTMREGEPSLYRLWGWMCAHTVHWGHRSPFAISQDGDALHIENAAEDLGMDEANAYRTWREGLRRGLWRNGTKSEGKRRLYLCGEVVESPDLTPDVEPKTVCTDSLPPYILKQIKDWPSEKRQEFLTEHALHVRVQNTTLAELMAAGRLILGQVEDSRFERWGLAKNRQDHTPKLSPEELQARQARLPVILPVVQRYVQTVLSSVQTNGNGAYTNGVQGSPDTASLYIEPSIAKPDAPSSSSSLSSPPSHTSSRNHDGKKSVNEQYAPGQPASAKSVAPNRQNGTHKTKPKQASEDEAMQLAKALEVDLGAGRQLLDGARGVDPAISLREVIGLCYAKLDNWRVQIRAGKIDNVPGRLIKSLPAAVTGGLRDSVRERVRRELEKEIEYAGLVIADEIASPEDKARELRRLQSLEEELSALGARSKGAAS